MYNLKKAIELCDGKYTFYMSEEDNTLRCSRYDYLKWREFIGDHAIYALYEYALELKDRLSLVTNERDELREENERLKRCVHYEILPLNKQALERGEQEDTMSRYIAAITNNQLEIHAAAMDAPEGYDTLCGMDIDDPAIGHFP